MKNVRLITIGEEIHGDNLRIAQELRRRLHESGIRMLNIMSSPGSGKTSLILKTIEALKAQTRICVVEADIDSQVDAEKAAAAGAEAVQLHTGGLCHVDAYMMEKTLAGVDLAATDLLILENIGNLICPAGSDTGAELNIVILSVPEGDDKPLKYPLIFRTADLVIVNKIDYLQMCDFDTDELRSRVRVLNPEVEIIELSCRTGEGVERWIDWLSRRLHLQPESGPQE
jgi:hydrogenase nickel incorporation protein HypB